MKKYIKKRKRLSVIDKYIMAEEIAERNSPARTRQLKDLLWNKFRIMTTKIKLYKSIVESIVRRVGKHR